MGNAKRCWSFSTGERGRNRVRAYEKTANGPIFLEFYETGLSGNPIRRRIALDTGNREDAKEKAEQLAAQFRKQGIQRDEPLTLKTLIDNYLREKTPQKGKSKQEHDYRAAALFLECFGSNIHPKNLTRREWDKFIIERRSGKLRPSGVEKPKPVRNRQIQYDLQFLMAVLNWAMTVHDRHHRPLLEYNPLRRLPTPREENPKRPLLIEPEYLAMRAIARQVSSEFELALVLAHETGHRLKSLLHLRWSDIDFENSLINWPQEFDKIKRKHETPLEPDTLAFLSQMRGERKTIGGSWMFPSESDPSKPRSRTTFLKWWELAEQNAKITHRSGFGWHSLRRKFVTERKHVPLKDLAYIGGWTNPQTILQVYQQPDMETMRKVVADRIPVYSVASR